MRQKELLREAIAGIHPQVDLWLEELDRTPAFYFDSITQLQLDTWSRGRVTGRVTLVGDAGYCPGPPSAAAPACRCSAPAYWPGNRPKRAATTRERSPPTSERWPIR
ncbi:hypothetical protein I551_0535 [Mycobacterium ulcerans str. Harvey]|uniref:Uncharacterized protein n=1 Tax=Mycobacterium ulcerans str. Harvey TaxID=1299332 RepID=A0ABP3APC6_MYCUL|nr:hypothetical protein I551_0535 [Mycobacterium ulcerans str. Harvey]